MKKINSVIYGLFGTGAIVYGIAALLFPAWLESNAWQSSAGRVKVTDKTGRS